VRGALHVTHARDIVNIEDARPAAAPAFRPTAASCWRIPRISSRSVCGSGLSPIAPGTAGTLWAWLAFPGAAAVAHPPTGWLIAASYPDGLVGSTVTAQP
jgi:phosphatidylglycerophosphatase A